MIDYSALTLTFCEEFTAQALDPTKWATALGWNGWTCRNQPPFEAQYYCDPNVPFASSGTPTIDPFRFTGNSLVITAAPSTDLTATRNLPYSSGVLSSQMFSQLFGRFEMRCKIGPGAGFWPAFWLLPKGIFWPPEIDIFEIFGGQNTHGEGGPFAVHTGLVGGTSTLHRGLAAAWHPVSFDVTGGFHTYGLDWHEDQLVWDIDGTVIASTPTPQQFTTPMYLIANLAVGNGGSWPGAPAAGASSTLEIDFIRAFSRFPDATPVPWPGTASPDGAQTAPVGAMAANGPVKIGAGALTVQVATLNKPSFTSLSPATFDVLVDGVAVATGLVAAADSNLQQWVLRAVPSVAIDGARTIGVRFTNPFWALPYNRLLRIESIGYADPANALAGTLTAAQLQSPTNGITIASDGSVQMGAGGIATFVMP